MLCRNKKGLDRVPRTNLEWAMRKKGILEALVRLSIGLYERKTKESVDSELSEEFEGKEWMHLGFVSIPFKHL